MRKIVLAVAALAVMFTPAIASQCPAQMAKVDEALKTAQLSDADKAKVMELRAAGEEYHNAGKHPESEAALAEALKLLGM
jgi:Ni/Co efflux regulator RcnB